MHPKEEAANSIGYSRLHQEIHRRTNENAGRPLHHDQRPLPGVDGWIMKCYGRWLRCCSRNRVRGANEAKWRYSSRSDSYATHRYQSIKRNSERQSCLSKLHCRCTFSNPLTFSMNIPPRVKASTSLSSHSTTGYSTYGNLMAPVQRARPSTYGMSPVHKLHTSFGRVLSRIVMCTL